LVEIDASHETPEAVFGRIRQMLGQLTQ
jgi:hypothetical protein